MKWNVHVTQHWGLSHSSAARGSRRSETLLTPSVDGGSTSSEITTPWLGSVRITSNSCFGYWIIYQLVDVRYNLLTTSNISPHQINKMNDNIDMDNDPPNSQPPQPWEKEEGRQRLRRRHPKAILCKLVPQNPQGPSPLMKKLPFSKNEGGVRGIMDGLQDPK